MFREYKTEVAIVVLVLALFVAAGYFSQMYATILVELLEDHTVLGMFIYVAGATVATVIAPLSFLPILPIAVSLWGSLTAAVLSIIAWTLGAAAAFLLAKRYGRPLVRHLVGERKMAYISGLLPTRFLFLAVVFLRMALPVDLLSYALGLFGVMRFWPYILATVIGITPFALIFAYLADINVALQIAALLIGVIFIALSYPYMKRRYKTMFLQNDGVPNGL